MNSSGGHQQLHNLLTGLSLDKEALCQLHQLLKGFPDKCIAFLANGWLIGSKGQPFRCPALTGRPLEQ